MRFGKFDIVIELGMLNNEYWILKFEIIIEVASNHIRHIRKYKVFEPLRN